MIRRRTIAVALAAAMTASTALLASTEYFLGKGDVQSAFGWNNAQLQENAESLEFSVEFSQEVTQQCKTTPEQEISGVRVGTIAVESAIDYSRRRAGRDGDGQVNGFWLTLPDAEDLDEEDVEWDRTASGGTGTGCPDGMTPKFAPTFGDVVITAIYATFDGTTVRVE